MLYRIKIVYRIQSIIECNSRETTKPRNQIRTDQNQSFKTENNTDYVDQTLKTEIETNQKGEINLEKNIIRK